MFDLFNLSTNSFSYPFTKQHFILYKQVTSQYDDPDILQYVNLLVPEKIKKDIKIDYRRPRLTEDDGLKEYQRQVLYELKSEMIHSKKQHS